MEKTTVAMALLMVALLSITSVSAIGLQAKSNGIQKINNAKIAVNAVNKPVTVNPWLIRADVNKDRAVNTVDLGLLAAARGMPCSKDNDWGNGLDVNRNGRVDWGDESIVRMFLGMKY